MNSRNLYNYDKINKKTKNFSRATTRSFVFEAGDPCFKSEAGQLDIVLLASAMTWK